MKHIRKCLFDQKLLQADFRKLGLAFMLGSVTQLLFKQTHRYLPAISLFILGFNLCLCGMYSIKADNQTMNYHAPSNIINPYVVYTIMQPLDKTYNHWQNLLYQRDQ